jgi:hypothetical protein
MCYTKHVRISEQCCYEFDCGTKYVLVSEQSLQVAVGLIQEADTLA